MTPQYVEMLLRGMLFGNHVQGMELFTVMIDSSPEIAACVQEYTDGVLKKRIVYEPYREEDEEPSPLAVEKTKVVSAAIRNMRPDATRDENGIDGTIKDIAFARFHGMSVLEADWSDTYGTGDRFLKRVPGMDGEVQCLRSTYWVHPVCYAFDNTGRVGLSITQDSMRAATRSARVDKGMRKPPVFTNSANNPRENVVMPFPENNFIIAIDKAKTGSVFGASCLRPLAWWWVASNFCGDYLMKYAELFGIPLRSATYDPNTPDKVKREIRELLQASGSEPWTMMPKGAEIKFERAQGGGADSPQAFLFHFANEQFRKVILHQTMSGGAKSQGTGVGKGGMETEHEGPKADCIDAGAKFVESVLNQQLVPAILTLNYGEDGDLEAPTMRLMDYEVGGLADAQRDTALAQIMDVPDGYLRRKYGVPRPAGDDKLAGIDVGVLGAQAAVQQQQHDDQMKAQADQAKQNAKVSMANANAIAKQTAKMPGAVKPQPSSTDDDDDGSGSMSAKRAAIQAASAALQKTVEPVIEQLKKISQIKDKAARIAAYKKFLAEQPALTAKLKANGALADETAAIATKQFEEGLKV